MRGKDDYGIMVLADRRFKNKKNQLPKWIAQALLESRTLIYLQIWRWLRQRNFLRTLAQPSNPKDQEGVSVWNLEQLGKLPKTAETAEATED